MQPKSRGFRQDFSVFFAPPRLARGSAHQKAPLDNGSPIACLGCQPAAPEKNPFCQLAG